MSVSVDFPWAATDIQFCGAVQELMVVEGWKWRSGLAAERRGPGEVP